jgi:hypothetical protein
MLLALALPLPLLPAAPVALAGSQAQGRLL